jgi:hypothetical protein
MTGQAEQIRVSSRNKAGALPLLRELICAWCQQAMAPRVYPGTPKLFCSARCRVAANRETRRIMRPNEFYTPAHIAEAARACMGGIDLDPASCTAANETIRAKRFYDMRDDGLKQPWFGKVWLNPPFGRFGPHFVKRAVNEFKLGNIEQAIILLKFTHLGTGWFHDSMTIPNLMCFPKKRINFTSTVIEVSTATFPSVLIGIGIERQRFEEAFSQLGSIR